MTAQAAACSAEDSFQSAADKMSSLGVGALPVVQNGQVVGMVTDRDLVVRGLSHNETAGTIQAVMSNNVVTISPDASVDEAAALMSQHQARRLPVVENVTWQFNSSPTKKPRLPLVRFRKRSPSLII
ncbi:MAG: CBS domain-containing protein [Bacillota bacterium]